MMKNETCVWCLYFVFSSAMEESAAWLGFCTPFGDTCFQEHNDAFLKQIGVFFPKNADFLQNKCWH